MGAQDAQRELDNASFRGNPSTGSDPTELVTSPEVEAALPDDVESGDARAKQARGFTGLTAAQLIQLLAGLVTAPILARGLGADGRGLLAAIAVPLSLAPFMLQGGLGAYAVNKTAAGVRPAVVFGSVGVPLLVLTGLAAALSPAIADVLGGDHDVVVVYLTLGLLLLPVSQLVTLTLDIAWGLSAWSSIVAARIASPIFLTVALAALYLAGHLTVANAAIVTIAGGLVPVVGLIPILRRIGRPRFSRRLSVDGVRFGARAWVGAFAALANQRLDQLIMIPLVPPRELAHYVVATTIASLSTVLTSQIVTVAVPRIAGGDHDLLPRAMRGLMALVLATSLLIAVGTMLLLVPVFGEDFAESRPLVMVLLIGWLAQAGMSTLSQALAAAGRPGATSISEVAGLTVTVIGLALLLPPLGPMGAALASTAAYFTSFLILARISTRHFGHRIRDYVVPGREDLHMMLRLARSVRSR